MERPDFSKSTENEPAKPDLTSVRGFAFYPRICALFATLLGYHYADIAASLPSTENADDYVLAGWRRLPESLRRFLPEVRKLQPTAWTAATCALGKCVKTRDEYGDMPPGMVALINGDPDRIVEMADEFQGTVRVIASEPVYLEYLKDSPGEWKSICEDIEE